MEDKILEEIYSYAVSIRRQFHEYPETGFELSKTVALVSSELEKSGIRYTYKYGKSSVVAEIGSGEKIIALRADMDALSVEEKTDLPYASKIKGKMHACGHDSHTAILLAVAKYLKMYETDLKVRVRLIFQPSEECAESGAKMMVENGVMDGVDHIICTHCENALDVGKIGVCVGDHMAACVPLNVKFYGKTAHATLPHQGIDAVAMAHTAYTRLKENVAKLAGESRYIWSVGKFLGGTAHNVVADFSEMDISFRFYDMAFADNVKNATFKICNEIAKEFGGRVEIDWNMSTGPVHNDKEITENFKNIAVSNGLQVEKVEQKMGSEDFGWYLTKSKGMLFWFGTRNEALGCTSLAHCNDFKIDENGMKTALEAFANYIFSLKKS